MCIDSLAAHRPRRNTRWFRARNGGAGAGFTLIEFLVALAVAAVLGGLGAAGYGALTGRTRVSAEVSDLLHSIELTRSEAAKRGMRVTLLPVSGDWSRGWTVFVDTNANRRVDPGEPLLQNHAPLKRSTRVIANTLPGYIAFGSGGFPQQYSGAFLAGSLTLCDAGSARGVILAKSGRPRLTSGTC